MTKFSTQDKQHVAFICSRLFHYAQGTPNEEAATKAMDNLLKLSRGESANQVEVPPALMKHLTPEQQEFLDRVNRLEASSGAGQAS